MVTLGMLLIGLFVSGASASCGLQPALSITTPKRMTALSGSCLQIPCSFAVGDGYIFNSTIRSFGVWLKNIPQFENNNNVIFNSSRKVKMDTITLTGSLSEKNCTTRFDSLQENDSDKYYFRVENGPFKATASCDPVTLTIKDSPRRPRVKISGDLKENESVTITCSAVTSCPNVPPKLTWNLQQDSHTQIKKNKDGTFTAKIQKNITLSDTDDGYNISCSVKYPVNEGKDFKTAETEETLRVSYAPKKTSASISPAGLVSAGTRVNLTCSSRASPPINFTWFKKSHHGDVKVAEGDFYSLNETDGVYYCVAANDLGNQRSEHLFLKSKEQSLPWEGVVGGIIGIVILTCVVLLIWRLKSSHSTSDQNQSVVLQGPVGTAEIEEIHYGEIDFSTLRPPSDSVQDSGQDQHAVYAQVKPHKIENGQTQAGDDIYALVKKK